MGGGAGHAWGRIALELEAEAFSKSERRYHRMCGFLIVVTRRQVNGR